MFLDGMGDQLSGLQKEDQASGEDHAEGYPLDGVEEISEDNVEKTGLAEEGKEKLRGAGCGEGQDEGVSRVVAAGELVEKKKRNESGRDGGIEGDGMETDGVGGDSDAPGERGGKASVGAFGEVAEGQEDPEECRAGSPGVQRGEQGEMAAAEVENRDDCGEQHARSCE
jgi:hypothetical protein